MSQSEFPTVNLADQRQDVHRQRRHNPGLFRYSVAERLLPQSVAGEAVLEIGGGTGEFTRRLLDRGARVTFADLNQSSLDRVAEQYPVTTLRCDLNEGLRGLADRGFRGVAILDVIEHVVAAEYLLAEIARVLAPGGFLVLTVPNFSYLFNRLRILMGRLSIDEGYHYRFFTRRVLGRRLETAGFTVEAEYHSTPAVGLNLIRNRILGRSRIHVRVPAVVAGLLAQSLGVRAVLR